MTGNKIRSKQELDHQGSLCSHAMDYGFYLFIVLRAMRKFDVVIIGILLVVIFFQGLD